MPHRAPPLRHRRARSGAVIAIAVAAIAAPPQSAPGSPRTASPRVAASLPAARSSPDHVAWRRPVPGAVSRPFAYSPDEPFVAGRHRGVDLEARPGAVVGAACTGRVAFAGRDVVTLRCGPWRVTHLPLEAAVRAGERVRAGARIGTLLASTRHAGLHLGVRREGDRFGYLDPLPFLGAAPPTTAIPVPREGPRGGPRAAPDALAPKRAPPARPTPVASPVSAPRSAPATVPRPAPGSGDGVRVPADRRIAPWPVWAGLALGLAGAIGGGIRVRGVSRRRVVEPVAS